MKFDYFYKLNIAEPYDVCWLCGRKGKLSKRGKLNKHHALNKCLNPKQNILIPLCKKCHLYIHDNQPKHLKLPMIDNKMLPNGMSRDKSELINTIHRLSTELNFIRCIRNDYEDVIMNRKRLEDIKPIVENVDDRLKNFNGSKWVRFK